MDVKQSFQNIATWAKKNPVLAGGIVLVLVLLAWWISKQGGGGGSSLGVSSEAEAPSEPNLGSLGSSGGSLLDTVANQTDGITQPAPVYDAPVFDALPALSSMSDAGTFDPGSFSPDTFNPPTTSGIGEAMSAMSAPGSLGKSAVSNLNLSTTDIRKPVAATSGTKGKTAKSAAKTKITFKRAPVVAQVSTPAKSAIVASKGMPIITRPTTPVLVPGFTGYLGGVYYYNGIPASTIGAASGVANLLPSSGPGRTGR